MGQKEHPMPKYVEWIVQRFETMRVQEKKCSNASTDVIIVFSSFVVVGNILTVLQILAVSH